MEGEQYEAWPVDQQPTAAQLRASQPKLITFECSLCATRLSATLDQVDEVIACPDCGAKTRVPPYLEKMERTPWREDDGEELDLEIVAQAPRRVAAPLGGTDLAAARSDAATPEAAKETTEYSTRPPLARWPLQTGILMFPMSKGVPVRLVLFSAWATFVVWLLLQGIGFIAIPYGGFITMFLLATSVILGIMCLSALAACWMAIVTETSEGNNVVQAWPDMVFLDWMFEGLYVVMAALISCIPGWLAALLWPDQPLVRSAVILGGAVVFFPVILLSMLDIGSPLAPLSPKILGSFFRAPGSWLVFWLEAILLIAALAGIALALLQWSPLGLVVLTPVIVLASIWYFRLLGRLAWVLAESTTSE
jgi:hypothetical protein